MKDKRPVELGLSRNLGQFTLLVIVNGFVGGMIGLERSILPSMAQEEFSIVSKTALLSFIIVFGIAKAVTNYFAGVLADRWGRKRLLVAGWLIAIPVPFIIYNANSWDWIVLSNVLLGVNQGLTWSSTVVMKIDLVGPRHRGLAMGINESIGYVAVGSMAYLTGVWATSFGYRDTLFFVGIALSLIGLALSYFTVRDTHQHVKAEQKSSDHKEFESVFKETTYKNPNLGSITQAGLVNNLNDGMVWGVLPVLLMQLNFELKEIGKLVAVYPLVWGFFQVVTGKLSDHLNKKYMMVFGMLLQGIALTGYWQGNTFNEFFVYSVLLGLGTATVYPTFLSAISDYVSPGQRAASIGVFRLWRDLGYAIGALLSGIIADLFGVELAVLSIALITFLSALLIQIRMASSH